MTSYDPNDTRDEAALRRVVGNLRRQLKSTQGACQAALDDLDAGRLPGGGILYGSILGRHATEVDNLSAQATILCEVLPTSSEKAERINHIVQTGTY